MSNEEQSTSRSPVAEWRLKLFMRSPLRRRNLQQMMQLLDVEAGQNILDLTNDDAQSGILQDRAPGLNWQHTATTPIQADTLTQMVGACVLADQPELPFEEASFDWAIINEMMEYVEDATAFMAECHRVMKPKTRLILSVRQRRRSLVGLFRRWAGLTDPSRPMVCSGFTRTELFNAMKDGFDVQEIATFGRFFTECTELLAELFSGLVPFGYEPMALDEARLRRAFIIYTIFTPVFFVARVLDALCFFLPKHRIVLRAKRRMLWVPRVTPVLKDGRSIAQAALGSKIGSALEF